MSVIAFDTETRGLDWWDPDQRAFLVSWADSDSPDGHVAHVDDAKGMLAFREDLKRADTVICHNVSFDVHQLRETCGIDLLTSGKTLIDTAHLAQVVLPERKNGTTAEHGQGSGYRLKDLAATYVDRSAADADEAIKELAKAAGIKLKSTGGYYDTWRAYPDEMEHYAREDARITLGLYDKLRAKVSGQNRQCWDLERTVAPVLINAERLGVAIDQEKVAPLKVEYERRAEVAYDNVRKGLGADVLGGNTALRDALLAHGVPLHRKTPTGELATNKFALQEFEDRFPVLKDLGEWRTATKFLSTYIEPMYGRDVVHPSFWQMGAWTGRMSCSRPNMQNIPIRAGSEVREVFVPRPGYSFVVCDYESIEVRLLAWYLNSPEYRGMIRDGLDPHAWMASNIWGGTMEDYVKGSPGEKQRGIAKNVLFAIVYGAGGPRVADMLNISIDEARALIKTIKATLPRYNALAGYNGRVRRKVETSGYVTTLFGRKQPVNQEKAYVGLNALIQGSAADIFKQGCINVAESVKCLGATPILFVHDELVVEVPTEHAEECLPLVQQGMCEAFALDPALEVSGNICHVNYAEGK